MRLHSSSYRLLETSASCLVWVLLCRKKVPRLCSLAHVQALLLTVFALTWRGLPHVLYWLVVHQAHHSKLLKCSCSFAIQLIKWNSASTSQARFGQAKNQNVHCNPKFCAWVSTFKQVPKCPDVAHVAQPPECLQPRRRRKWRPFQHHHHRLFQFYSCSPGKYFKSDQWASDASEASASNTSQNSRMSILPLPSTSKPKRHARERVPNFDTSAFTLKLRSQISTCQSKSPHKKRTQKEDLEAFSHSKK